MTDHPTTVANTDGENVGATDIPYTKQFDIELGTVVVEDKQDGEEVIIWKASTSDGTVRRSDSPVDAVMGVIESVSGGVV